MLDDLRTACRSLLRRPSLTSVSVVTLALAAGANAAILAVVYGILLKPLPYAHPDELVAVWPGRFQSNADLEYLRQHARPFRSIAAVAPGWTMALTGVGEPAKITVARVSGNLFQTLGITPALGRTFSEREARSGQDSVIVLSHSLWTRQFGADPGIVGRVIRLEGEPFEVWGVLPPDFEVLGLKSDAYTPFALSASAWYHQLSFSLFIARLSPGVTVASAERQYRDLIPEVRRQRRYPNEYGRTATLQGLRAATVGDISSSLVVLGAAVALILVIAGANVGTLLLTRATGRARELAVRTAVGASRARLTRELLAESVVIAIAGGAAGLVFARATLPLLVAILPKDTPRMGEIGVNLLVGGGVLGVATVMALIFGATPALAVSRLNAAPLLRAGASSESRQARRARAMLVSGEIALALVLAIAAGLMLQSIWRIQQVDPGFQPDHVLTLHLQPTDVGSRGSRSTAAYYQLVLEHVRSLPGVAAAGAIQHLPFSGYSWTGALDVQGVDVPAGASRPTAGLRIATPLYFNAIRQPVVAGRDFEPADANCRGVVIVNQALARKHFGSARAALGRQLRVRGGGVQSAWLTIVGVVGDVRHAALTSEPVPEIYTCVSQNSINAMMLAIRTGGDPLSAVPAVRQAIWSVDRNVPISDVQTMSAKIGASLARPRLLTILLGAFAALGVMLSVVGVYGVVAYSVTQRRREIGIAIALGAERARIVRTVLREGLIYSVGGLATGLPAALLVTRFMQSVLYGITPTDLFTYALLALAVVGVVLAACLVPAQRASRVDPLSALRSE